MRVMARSISSESMQTDLMISESLPIHTLSVVSAHRANRKDAAAFET